MKKNILLISIIFISGFVAKAQNQNIFSKEIFVNSWGDSLLYRMLQPVVNYSDCTVDSIKYPLVIFLHGAGERGNDNEKQLIHGAKLFIQDSVRLKYKAFVVVPQCPEKYRWVETDWTLPSHKMPQISIPANLTMQLISELSEKFPIDTNRIYITGLSMGGFGTWDLISRFPEKFAAAVPICGGADTTYARAIKNVPIWAFHGAKDKLVTVNRTRNIVAAIKKAGGKPKYTEFPNLGHFSWNAAYASKELIPWLFSQSKKE